MAANSAIRTTCFAVLTRQEHPTIRTLMCSRCSVGRRVMSFTITLCGGTSLAHALAAVLAADPENAVRVWTRQPGRWSTKICAIYRNIAEVEGPLALVTNDLGEALSGASLNSSLYPPTDARVAAARNRSLPQGRHLGGWHSGFWRVRLAGRVDLAGMAHHLRAAARALCAQDHLLWRGSLDFRCQAPPVCRRSAGLGSAHNRNCA